MSDNIEREDRDVFDQHALDALDFGSHPPELFALQLQTATDVWTLNRICLSRAQAENDGEYNRAGLPWRVLTYQLVDDESIQPG